MDLLMTLWQLDPTPEPDDVVAGWGAFGIFGLGILAIGLLGWSLVHRLRNVDAAEEKGLYDPTDRKPRGPEPSSPDPRRPADPRSQDPRT